MKKLYIEFYNREIGEGKTSNILLRNGFSAVYNLCEDIVAIEMDWLYPEKTVNELKEKCKNYTDVYITSFWWREIFLIYLVSKDLPEVNFTVGGPSAIWMHTEGRFSELPKLKNFVITGNTLDSVFNNFNNKKWGLNIPNIEYRDDEIVHFVIPKTIPCSWGRCKFCDGHSISNMPITNSFDTNFIEKLPDKIKNLKKAVMYSASSFTAEDIQFIVPIINRDPNILHYFFWRAERQEAEKLKYVMEKIKYPENLFFFVGVEFLGTRMLKYIDKGLTAEDYIYTLQTINQFGSNLALIIILGWNNLIYNDVDDIYNNFSKLDLRNSSMKTRVLTVTPMTEKHFSKDFIGCEKVYFPIELPEIKDRPDIWKDSYSWKYKLIDEKQKMYNNAIVNILKDMKFKTFFDNYKSFSFSSKTPIENSLTKKETKKKEKIW